MRTAAKTLGTLGLLSAALPLNAALTATALARRVVVRPQRVVAAEPKTILLSGGKMTKSLQLARSFHEAGHRVVLVESAKYRLTGHRFSTAVDAFHVVPEPTSPHYADALLEVVRAEGVDVYVPVCSPVSSYFDAQAKKALSEHCEVVHPDADVVQALDDKHEFSAIAASYGLAVPESHRITDPQQVLDFDFTRGKTYVMKNLAYDPVRRLDLTRLPRPTPAETAAFVRALPITDNNPWILQEFIEGREFCTHGTVREGQLQVYCCCASSAFQINYAHLDKPEIETWVRRFVGALGVTGQLSFDFLQTTDGSLYAIECNPRTHSAITMFYDHPDLARAYLKDGVPVVTPTEASRPTYWLYHEVWRLLTRARTPAQFTRTVWHGKDAIFDWSDPLPFLLEHHLQIPALLLASLRQGKPWTKIDFNIGKLVEPGGD